MVRLFVTYLEQTSCPPEPALSPPSAGARISREIPGAADYLQLYRAVGTPVQWDVRLRMPAAELSRFLHSPSTAVFVLRQGDAAVGLCEFDGVGTNEIELQHFGLVPAVQGLGLGAWLLDWSLRAIWSQGPRRVWLHTDTNDHEKARTRYERAGFKVCAERWEEFPD